MMVTNVLSSKKEILIKIKPPNIGGFFLSIICTFNLFLFILHKQKTKMENLTFTGIERNNEINLLEYGLLVSKETHNDGSGTHFIVYRIDDNHFDCGHISEKDVNNYILGNQFPNQKQINQFLKYVGMQKKDWLKMPLNVKIQDLLNYWGYENIMGTSYHPIKKNEAISRFLN
jgi:hypothetical protein